MVRKTIVLGFSISSILVSAKWKHIFYKCIVLLSLIYIIQPHKHLLWKTLLSSLGKFQNVISQSVSNWEPTSRWALTGHKGEKGPRAFGWHCLSFHMALQGHIVKLAQRGPLSVLCFSHPGPTTLLRSRPSCLNFNHTQKHNIYNRHAYRHTATPTHQCHGSRTRWPFDRGWGAGRTWWMWQSWQI